MTSNPSLRRLLVTLGVAGSLLVAGLTIRAASLWAANQAPLTVAPVSVQSVQAALEQERSRSAALEAQLAELEASSADLTAALQAAQDRVGEDQATAEDLRASLAAAQDKLTKLEAALKAAAAKRTTTTVRTTTSTSTSSGEHEGGEIDDD
jgi:septal ring factor EnvC (AmiA/AmiB activator)